MFKEKKKNKLTNIGHYRAIKTSNAYNLKRNETKQKMPVNTFPCAQCLETLHLHVDENEMRLNCYRYKKKI